MTGNVVVISSFCKLIDWTSSCIYVSTYFT